MHLIVKREMNEGREIGWTSRNYVSSCFSCFLSLFMSYTGFIVSYGFVLVVHSINIFHMCANKMICSYTIVKCF
jgi:hypothetical protein